MKSTQGRGALRVAAGGAQDSRPVLITGGAGFIGTNIAHRLLAGGQSVVVFDNLSRPGVERNVEWLREQHRSLLRVELADVRDRATVQRAVSGASRVIHLAAQVAVTTSMADPVADFDVNAAGTFNVLNALRLLPSPPPLLFTSTNKVYGNLEDVALATDGRRYQPLDPALRDRGIDESRPLDFRSPYGCSKGAADQYVVDFARTYDLQAVVMRMSCIYGPRQFGTEDQGWVAHFLIRALRGEPITLYGDGQQVRDVLFVDDLVDAVQLAFGHMDAVSGRAFNMGGGPDNTTSLVELVELIGELTGERPDVHFEDWRPGDQRYYVSDASRFSALTGWRPRVPVADGVRALHEWLVTTDLARSTDAVPRRWARPAGTGGAGGATAAGAAAAAAAAAGDR
jgi:CDP-paratose 2-epimerase